MSKIQPNVVDYIDTQLIECNRLQSATVSNEPGVFTSTQRSGINIEPGDKISLNSAYVSEVGAGGEVIEFTGVENGDEYEVEYTDQTFPIPTKVPFNGTGNPYRYQYENLIPYIQDDSIQEYREFNNNVKKNFKVKDNEMNFTTGFYKTSNGEGYFHLPRRFISGHSYFLHQQLFNQNIGDATQQQKFGKYQNNTYYHINEQSGILSYKEFGEVTDDFVDTGVCRADHHYRQMVYDAPGGGQTGTVIAKKNDNSKYQILVRNKTEWFAYNQDITADFKSIFTTDDNNNFLFDIAMNDYIEYKQLQKLTVDVGFDTPSNIASKLTEQLNKSTVTPVKCVLPNASGTTFNGTDPSPEQYIYSNKFETPVFKAFKSATEQSFSQTASRRFFGSMEDTSGTFIATTPSTCDTCVYNQSTLDYFNSYHFIGVKRPEIYKTGCVLNRASRVSNAPRNFQMNSSYTPSTTGHFQINVKWDEINASSGRRYLDDFKDFFESQDLYPEIFDYTNQGFSKRGLTAIDVDNTKLIHMSRFDSLNEEQLGGDTMVYPGDTAVHTAYPRPDNESSVPVFINYKREQRDNIDYQIYGHNTNDLWGGFAYRTQYTDGEDYITFNIPASLEFMFSIPGYLNGSGIVPRDRGVGYDQHFSGYANSMIALYSGINTFDFVDAFENDMQDAESNPDFATSLSVRSNGNMLQDKKGRVYFTGFDKFKFSYIGALSPKVSFDTNSDRFTISGLHSPEHIGNYPNAGANYVDTTPAPGKAESPDQQVYYINKRLKNNNFCPDMTPYQQSRQTPVGGSNPIYKTATFVQPFNDNLESGVIYDQFSGLKINDFGTNETNWDNNSIMGIMGFDYDILNPKNPSNFQTKYNFDFSDHTTDGLMTSALVQAQETLSQSQNFMTAPYYNYTMPQASSPNLQVMGLVRPVAFTLWIANGFKSKPNNPNVVQNTVTAVIKASKLPKKTIRPYYLIRSNIISNDNFIGGRGERLPVIGLVNKVNGYADFYSSVDQGVEFTATRPYTIQNITTSIHTPDGKLAPVSDASSVIYKIQKNLNLTTNLSEIIMGQ